MTQAEQSEIILNSTPEIVNLKWTEIENDPNRIEPDSNIFRQNYFSLRQKLTEPKIGRPEINYNQKWPDSKLNPIRILLTRTWLDPNITWPKYNLAQTEQNDPFASQHSNPNRMAKIASAYSYLVLATIEK